MYSSFNTLEHEKKRIQNDVQNDMRGILINQHSNHLEQRANIQGSALMQQRMSHFEPSRIDPPIGQRQILPRREEPRDQMKQASHMEQERTLHMNHFLEKQRIERDAQRINDQVDAIKKIYSKYNPHEYDPPREHYREQDLGPAVNQLIDLLNSFKLSSTVLSSVANNTSANDLSLYATLASPTFTGTPNTSTPSYTENSTRIPTTQWVNYVVTDKLGNYVTSSALSAYNYVTTSALTAADYATNSTIQTNYVSKSLLSSYDYLTTYSAQTYYVSKSLLSSYDYASTGYVQSFSETNYVSKALLSSYDYLTNSSAQTNYVSKSLLSSYDYLSNSSAQTNYVSKSLLSSYDYLTNSSAQTNYVSKSLLSSYDYLSNSTAQTALNLKANLTSPAFTGTVTGITSSMVGLGNVDNTSDANKPVSSATQTALDLKANLTSPAFTGTVTGITSSMVGLGNVDNTSDANKPVSSATQTALNLKANLTSPAFTGTVTGITSSMVGLGNVDNTSDANKPVSSATQTALNLKANLTSPAFTGTVTGITSSMVGLGNVDNTSDANKPVSSATQTALNLKSNLANPTFTGTVTLPAVAFTATPSSGTAAYTLGIDSNNAIIRTTGSGGSVSQTTISTNASYAIPMSSSSSSGTFTPYIDANNLLTYNPYTGIFKTPICSIPKSTSTHPNLDQYELTVGDNDATTNKSAKAIIRGQSATDSFGPSLDFTAWSSHATPQARIEVLDDGNWGGTLSFFTKANAGGSSGTLTKNMYLNTTSSGVSQMVFPTTPNIITSGSGYNWYIGGTQVGYFDYPSSNWRIATNSTQKLILGSYNQNTLQIGNSASGNYPVEIYNYKTTYGSYWQYTGGGSSWGVSTTNFNIGLYVQYTVSADGGYLLASDERIKTNIKDASRGSLDVIKTIPIKSHGYIDSFLNGCPTAFNVIAQDIQRTYPEAITVTESYIPDMFVKCNWISVTDNQIRINIPKPHTVVIGDKVRCILEDSSQKDTTVIQIINTTTFVVEKWDDFDLEKSDEMFLYGKLVHDFLRVDKIKLGVLALAGVKEQQTIIEEQQQTISTMASQIGTLTNIINQLLKKYPL